MLTTIEIGSCVSVQGHFVLRHANGMVTVRVGDQLYTGHPVNAAAAA